MDKSKVIVSAAVIVVLLGGGVYLAMRDDTSTDSAQQSTTTNSSSSEPTVMNDSKLSKNIVELAAETPDLSALVTAVQSAELDDTLQGAGPFTVFAPTNDAFAKLPAGTLDTLLKPENKAQLQTILTYHVIPAKAMSTDLSDGQVLTTVQGSELTVSIKNGEVVLTDAAGGMSKVIQADIEAENGVVHVIDSVVLPQ